MENIKPPFLRAQVDMRQKGKGGSDFWRCFSVNRWGRMIFLFTSLEVFTMAGKGPAPKPSHLRQRQNKKAGAATLEVPLEKPKIPTLQNPDKRKFHRLTRAWWKRVWSSPMASEYLESDIDGLARLALLVDDYYKAPYKGKELMSEIRLQEARFGLSPVDRSRLQWEVAKGEEAERKRKPPKMQHPPATQDPRGILGVVE